MGEATLSAAMLEVLAERFKGLGEPARLRILNVLRKGEHTVGEVMELTGLRQANVSRHLRVLHELGFVQRRKEKLFVYYALTGEDVFMLCDMMCARVEDDVRRASETFGAA